MSVPAEFDVVETSPGTATTDFGAPAAFAGTDSGPFPAEAAARAAALVQACWGTLDRVAAGTAWPVPYAARRIGWHALDHAWEMEDRA